MSCTNQMLIKHSGDNNFVFSGKYNFPNHKQKPFHFPVRCGQCDYCKLYRSKVWAARCVLESSNWKFNYFITLTYNDNYLPIVRAFDNDTGALSYRSNLVLKHLQNFFKFLRKKGYQFKYLASGEYGSTTKRAHYHLVLFSDLPLPLNFVGKNSSGYRTYTSDLLSKAWKFGFHNINDFTPETAAYVAQYTLKKLPNKKHKMLVSGDYFYKQEFIVMSKNLGFTSILKNLKSIEKTTTISYNFNGRIYHLPIWRTALDKLEKLGYYPLVQKLRNAYRLKAQHYNNLVMKKSNNQWFFEQYKLIAIMNDKMLKINHNKL